MSANRHFLDQVAAQVVPSGATATHLGTGGFASTFKVVTLGGETYALRAGWRVTALARTPTRTSWPAPALTS